MKRLWQARATVVAILLPIAAIACGDRNAGEAAAPDTEFPPPSEVLPQLTIAYGGDTILGRRLNSSVLIHGLKQPLLGVGSVLESADVAVVNVEGVLSSGGTQVHKYSRGASYLRGRPELARVLTTAGVDVALAANDHMFDYGKSALIEHLSILRRSGIDPLGAGANRDAATLPVWHKLGGTVVAFVGVHTTTSRGASTQKNAGTSYADEAKPDTLVKRVYWQVLRARLYADLVVLVIHWGRPNSNPEPSDGHRELARRFVREAGIDALLGSGSHVMQGIEIIDGRPIIYDAGSLLLDWKMRKGTRRWDHQSAIFLLHANQQGFVQLEAVPILLGQAETRALDAEEDPSREVLERLSGLSRSLGTRLAVERGRAYLSLKRDNPLKKPKKIYAPPEPQKAAPPTSSSYTPDVIVTELPESAKPLGVTFAGGIELLGVELPENVALREGLRVTTYWRAQQQIDKPFEFIYRASCDTGSTDSTDSDVACGRTWRTRHQPGDWLYPMRRWQPGQIVRDAFFVPGPSRSGSGPHKVEVSLVWRGHRPLIEEPARLRGEKAAELGTVRIEAKRPRKK